MIAKEFAIKHLKEFIDHIDENEELIDFKTILQEFSQREYKVIPSYEVIKEMGPDHRKSFEIAVKINDELMGLGTGRNKKSAEQSAARNACRKLGVKAYETL
jgi:ribonuclease-3